MTAPGAASYTGFLGEYGATQVDFANGVVLKDVVHVDPIGTPFPAGTERFTAFTLASEDGKPLAQTSKAVLTLVSSSFNTGLAFQQEKPDWGHEPVLVTRVGATVIAKDVAGMHWRAIDFNERELATGVVGKDGVVKIPADKPVWLTELTRP
jgi:hypothetical protein